MQNCRVQLYIDNLLQILMLFSNLSLAPLMLLGTSLLLLIPVMRVKLYQPTLVESN